jgi:uncharacterized protein YecE (DUF72 family)
VGDRPRILVGTAGWSIAARHADSFPGNGTHLQRYARHLDAVEINSSFHRPHRRETYERWASSVAEDFRFSVKLPKTITHERRLVDCRALLDLFMGQVVGLGEKLAVLLVQLPPSLQFDELAASAFFADLRSRTKAGIALEPRHESWFGASVADVIGKYRVSRVAADPARIADADRPAGWKHLAYFRLHGSPRIYRSDYSDRLEKIAADLSQTTGEVWCIFDNTTESHALGNALSIARLIK